MPTRHIPRCYDQPERSEGEKVMSRKDALLRIHKSLVAKRDELRKQLANELDLAHPADAGTGDRVRQLPRAGLPQ